MTYRPLFVPFDGPVGRGTGPFCADCGLDLSLSREQIAFVEAYGNPVPRPSCPARRGDGLHRLLAPDPPELPTWD